MPDRPNVLFLLDDEHRPDVLGYAGDDVVRTPTLNRPSHSPAYTSGSTIPRPASSSSATRSVEFPSA